MYVCMRACVCVRASMAVWMNGRMDACKRAFVYVCTYAGTYARMYAYMHMCECVYVSQRARDGRATTTVVMSTASLGVAVPVPTASGSGCDGLSADQIHTLLEPPSADSNPADFGRLACLDTRRLGGSRLGSWGLGGGWACGLVDLDWI